MSSNNYNQWVTELTLSAFSPSVVYLDIHLNRDFNHFKLTLALDFDSIKKKTTQVCFSNLNYNVIPTRLQLEHFISLQQVKSTSKSTSAGQLIWVCELLLHKSSQRPKQSNVPEFHWQFYSDNHLFIAPFSPLSVEMHGTVAGSISGPASMCWPFPPNHHFIGTN